MKKVVHPREGNSPLEVLISIKSLYEEAVKYCSPKQNNSNTGWKCYGRVRVMSLRLDLPCRVHPTKDYRYFTMCVGGPPFRQCGSALRNEGASSARVRHDFVPVRQSVAQVIRDVAEVR